MNRPTSILHIQDRSFEYLYDNYSYLESTGVVAYNPITASHSCRNHEHDKTEQGEIRSVQPLELCRTQQYATAIYRIHLAEKLQGLGYQIEVDQRTGAPEIKRRIRSVRLCTHHSREKKRGKTGTHWHYYFRVRGVRYRGVIPEARTKWEAEQAETKIKQEIFEGRFGQLDLGSEKLADFIEKVFVPWSKANKRSWRHDEFRARTIREYFGGKTFREISPLLVEKFKRDRRESITAQQTVRSLASVNLELNLLSKIFNLAIDYQVTNTNPCTKVKNYVLDNKRYRYLLPEEEPALMAALEGPRAHLKPMVKIALGTGMRLGEQLRLCWERVDLSRGVLLLTRTKSGKDREVPMNPEVFEILSALRKRSPGRGYVFINPHTGERVKEIKKGFKTALKIAGIEGLVWHDLRATFGTRLVKLASMPLQSPR